MMSFKMMYFMIYCWKIQAVCNMEIKGDLSVEVDCYLPKKVLKRSIIISGNVLTELSDNDMK